MSSPILSGENRENDIHLTRTAGGDTCPPGCRCVGDKRGRLPGRYVPESVSHVALESKGRKVKFGRDEGAGGP